MRKILIILFTVWAGLLSAQTALLKEGGAKAVAGTDYQLPLTNPVTGTGTTNQWGFFTGSSTIGTNNSLVNNSGHLNAQSAGSIQMPSRTTVPGQNRALFSRSDLGNNLFYQTPDALVYNVMLGRQFMSGKYNNWTSSVLDIPEIYSILTGTNGQRWTKSTSGSTSAGGTYVVTYALNTQALTTPANGGFTYPGGTMYFWFNGANYPQSISLRFQDASNTWHGPISVAMTNVSTADQGANNGIDFNLYKRQLGSFANFIKTIEITYVAQPAVSINLGGEAYILTDASDFVNTLGNVITNDATVQQIYPNLEGRGSAGLGWSLTSTGQLRISNDFRPNNLPGTAGQVLTSAGSGNAPTWQTPFITSISGTYSPLANASGLSVTAGVGILHQVTFTSPGILANGSNNLGGSITARVDDDYGFIVDQIGTAGYGYAFKVSNVLKAEIIAMPNGSNSDVDFTAQRSGGGVDSWLKYNGATNTTTFMDGTNGKLKLANILVQPYGSLTTTGVFTLSNSVVYVNLSADGTITIPTTYPDGSVLELFNESTTGVVITVTADTGETLSGSLSFSTNGEFRRLRKKGTVWKLF